MPILSPYYARPLTQYKIKSYKAETLGFFPQTPIL